MPIDSKMLANKKLREISSRLRASDIDEIRKLIADGVDLDIAGQKYGFTILHLAVSRGYADIVNVIINAGGNVNVTLNKAGNGSTPLHVAVENSNSTIVKSLIAAGANVNAKKLSGSTPLSIATKYNRNDIVSILKKAGAK
jgi:cytohesin